MRYSKSILFIILWVLSIDSALSQTVTYLGNEGMLIEYQGKKIIIDGLFDDISGRFDSPDYDVMDDIIAGRGEYKNVELALITHAHPDHFDAPSFARFMFNNKKAKMVATLQAIDSMKLNTDLYDSIANRIAVTRWTKGWQINDTEDIGIKSAYTLHAGKAFTKVQNQMFLITIGDKKILHVADTQMDVDYFDDLRLIYEDIDLAIVPFWFLTNLFGAEIVDKHIEAKKVAGMHLPNKDNEKTLEKINSFFPKATVFSEPGQKISF
ncbi:MBL fold metallo-hydrolase [Reichenbachiella ulvae]|uniref:MBL fold metallo-hydrolase n=1 Tax=Reichenbachiella ulvae TaxID=2980104 RepID=A0ABT3CT02_9BACT|nr:MBL fold metallo-hydrolase [Reichenbachiella ulvae]MCV9386762.1 MBL fold metallo-hydrolase [Reichenbachiella ulvae]